VGRVSTDQLRTYARSTEPWTAEHWAALPLDGRRYELLDGALLVGQAASPERQEVVHGVMSLLAGAVPAGTRVAHGPGVLAGDSLVVPDVVVVRADADADLGARSTVAAGDVLLAVEVAEQSNATTALLTLPALLAAAGVPAYWRYELHAGPALVLHRLAADSYAQEGRLREGQVQTLTTPFQVTVGPSRVLR